MGPVSKVMINRLCRVFGRSDEFFLTRIVYNNSQCGVMFVIERLDKEHDPSGDMETVKLRELIFAKLPKQKDTPLFQQVMEWQEAQKKEKKT